MNNPPRREAKIYRFPNRMRIVSPDVARVERTAPVRLFAACDAGAGWYHEAAIQDEARDRKP